MMTNGNGTWTIETTIRRKDGSVEMDGEEIKQTQIKKEEK